ncbi:MAG TPA: prepilin-type N-terminal cleavage/methylation domain-containing protein [Thermoguttaceae bacterium]|nr:prepilin-type N-terminal cleavage/methylation domain-containing protein [Thermoguttaceae bacterium]
MTRSPNQRRVPAPAGFTLIEALVAVSITALAGSILLLGTTTTLQTTDEGLYQSIANGMAQQLMDEVAGNRYHAIGVDGRQIDLGPSSYEQQGSGRERYDDIDDFDEWRTGPPEDPWGITLGIDDGEGDKRHPALHASTRIFDHWRQEVDVYYVDETDLTKRLPFPQTSDYRVIEVRILHDDPERGSRELAKLRRVVAYVPPL